MASLKLVVVPAKALSDGRHKIRISISHNGDVRYIATDIIIDNVKQFKSGQIVKRPDANIINTKLRGILQKYQEALDAIQYPDGLSCAELTSLVKAYGHDRHRTIESVFEEYMQYSKMKQSSREVYEMAYRSITKHIKPTMLVENITMSTLLSLESYLAKKRMANSTIAFRMRLLKTIINYAKKCGYVEFRIDPTKMYSPPKDTVRDSWLTLDELRMVRDVQLKRGNISKVRDLFMLSYYLGGINFIDLHEIDFSSTKTIKYERTKTNTSDKLNKYVEFTIPDEARQIIEQYRETNGKVFQKFNRNNIYYYMKQLSDMLGLPQLIYYSARKSFAQHAFNLGISTSVIDYILGHSIGGRRTSIYSYIAVTPQLATDAVRQVLDKLAGK